VDDTQTPVPAEVNHEVDDTQRDTKALPTAGMEQRSQQSVTSTSTLPSTSPPALPPPPSTPPPSPPPSALPPPPSPSPPPPTLEVTWEKLGGYNCWWGGHGSLEVDSPDGTAVAGATTVDKCKAACLESGLPRTCDGFLFQPSEKKCFRKASIEPSLCSKDAGFELYVRSDPYRPPSAPAVEIKVQSGLLSSKSCSAMMRDPDHKFQSLWAMQGWSVRHRGEAGCWAVDWAQPDWFQWVATGSSCGQTWGNNLNAPTVFGFAESMTNYCNLNGGNGGDPGGACMSAGFNILRIGDWNMCRNVEWMVCVVEGKASYDRGDRSREIRFTHPPGQLNIDDFNSRPGWYIENDIYYLEVCVLNEMCANGAEIFTKAEGEAFVCEFDAALWAAAGKALTWL